MEEPVHLYKMAGFSLVFLQQEYAIMYISLYREKRGSLWLKKNGSGLEQALLWLF